MSNSSLDAASAAQRTAFVDEAADAALETPDAPRTPEGIERAWSAAHREGRADASGQVTLTLWNFDVASAILKPKHEQALDRFLALDRFADNSSATAAIRFRITGHASLTGSERGNLTISGRRGEAVEAYMSSRFRIPINRRVTGGFNPGQEGMATIEDVGEWYAHNRQVRIERLAPTVPVPAGVRGGASPPPEEADAGAEAQADVNLAWAFKFEFRVPKKGVYSPGGWVNVFGSVSGQGKISPAGASKATWVNKFGLGRNGIKVPVDEFEKKLSEDIKLKLGLDVGGAPPGLPVKGGFAFRHLGPLTNMELAFNVKELRDGPVEVSKSFKEAYQFALSGQEFQVDAEIKLTLNFSLGPTSLTRLGIAATQAVRGAAITEAGGLVAAPVAGGLAVGVGAVAVFIAVTWGMAKTVEWSKDEATRRALLMARRTGFALTVAAEAIRLTPETTHYVSVVDKEYPRLGQEVWQAYAAGKEDARRELRALHAEGSQQLDSWLDAVTAKYGIQIEQAHDAIFKAIGGIEKGEEGARPRLADLGVVVARSP